MGRTTGFRRKVWRPLLLVAVALAVGVVAGKWTSAQQADAPAATTPAAETPAAPAAAAPALPPYYSGGDPAKWPDPTGANAGYWATPSAGPVGDGDPAALTIPGLYDRVAHNLFSINFVWVLVAGFLVMFMQAGFAAVETGLCR